MSHDVDEGGVEGVEGTLLAEVLESQAFDDVVLRTLEEAEGRVQLVVVEGCTFNKIPIESSVSVES